MKIHLASGALMLGLAAALAGCGDGRADVAATQPVAFSHEKHMDWFTSGKHREEMVRMHLTALEIEKAPKALTEGRCVKCHEDLETKTKCVACHLPSQDAALRERTDVRACIACHGGTWTGSMAGIPSNAVCVSCHGDKPRTTGEEEKKLRAFLDSGRDLPWIQLHEAGRTVHFSHVAHVRFGKMDCTTCHEDMRHKEAPPTSVTVFTMDKCLKCHRDNHATSDCISCHK